MSHNEPDSTRARLDPEQAAGTTGALLLAYQATYGPDALYNRLVELRAATWQHTPCFACQMRHAPKKNTQCPF